jgi:signal transduction histidine kinase
VLGRPPWRARWTIYHRVLFANGLAVLVGAVAGTHLARRLSDESSVVLAAIFSLGGGFLTVVANYLALRTYVRPLLELSKTLDSMHRGSKTALQDAPGLDPNLGRMVLSLERLVGRLEDESLQISARRLRAVEAERQRIGRELHDGICQTLGSAAPQAKDVVVTVRDLVAESVGQLRTLVYDLRPSMLDDFGLGAALRWHIKTHLLATGIQVSAEFDEASGRPPRDVETALYRIAQEAIANVVRHSEATRTTTRLEIRAGYASFSVIDNGKGFVVSEQPAREKNGVCLGLLSIRERVTMLGGTVHIESAPGEGTRLYVVIPFEANSSSQPVQDGKGP